MADEVSVRPRVIVYGDTLFLSAVAEALRASCRLEVVQICPRGGESQWNTAQPDVVVVDAAQVSPAQLEALIASVTTTPGPPFIRLSASARQLTIHSVQQYPAMSLSDLAQVIEKLSKHFPNP